MVVRTELSSEEMAAVLSCYNGVVLKSFYGISEGTENSNFMVFCTSGRQYILTIFENRTDFDGLRFAIDLQNYLQGFGLPTAASIVMNDGFDVGEVREKKCALFEFLPGKSYNYEDFTPAGAQVIGKILAKMHVAGSDFPQKYAQKYGHPYKNKFGAAFVTSTLARPFPSLQDELEEARLLWRPTERILSDLTAELPRGGDSWGHFFG